MANEAGDAKLLVRRWTSFFALLFLAGCAPPHPTHPTKIDCSYQIETRFQARIDRSSPGTTNAGEDACDTPGGLVILDEWTQTDWLTTPICVAAGTTPEQAATYCSSRLTAIGVRVGEPSPPSPLPFYPFGGRVCRGSEIPLWSRYTALGGPSEPHLEGCREGTTWPLMGP
jgi:hypothetical protein